MAIETKIDAVAYHEAGHVLVAVLTDKIRVLEVYYDGTEGYTKVEWQSGCKNYDKLCYFLAGEIAEYLFSKDYSESHSGIDRKNTENVLLLMGVSRDEHYIYWKRAIGTVHEWLNEKDNAQKIQAIAEALMQKQTLSEDDVNEILKL